MYSCIRCWDVPNGDPTMRNVVRPDGRSTVWICTASWLFSTKWRRLFGTSPYGPALTTRPSSDWDCDGLASTGSNVPADELTVSVFGVELVSLFSACWRRLRTASAAVFTPCSSRCATATESRVAWIAASSLVSRRRSVIWFCSTMPSTNTTADDSASVLTTTRTCNERRHTSPNCIARCCPNATARAP
jgi:hypothetical protein